ncbi:MAG TPA: sensor histidine kinase [Candidatus Binatia bacterium]|nr:sensor histidine kinase [Candidatus Binatia bacterium]
MTISIAVCNAAWAAYGDTLSIMESSTDQLELGNAAEPASHLLLSRTRVILWIALVVGVVFTGLELVLATRLEHPFFAKCVGMSLTGLALVLLRGPWVERRALAASLAVILAAYLLTAISGMVSPSREYETTAVLFIGGALTTATLLPWGPWPQAVTVLFAAALLCTAVGWADGDLMALIEDPGAAIAIGLMLSVMTAREMQRYRLSSLRELAARRRAELEVRALNTDLERRVAERTEALRAANEQLHALSARVESVREEERTRIAREVHDELGQMITALKIDIDLLPRRLAGADIPPPLWRKLSAMSDLANTVINSVQRISAELRPSVLDDLGLREAIQWQAHEFERRCGVACTFRCSLPELTLDPMRSTALFRILQEALTNVARHAAARHVTISLRLEDDQLVLEVEDDGRGVTHAETTSPHSLGFLGMRERARLLGGEVEIAGVIGRGTTVHMRIPHREAAVAAVAAGGSR